MRTRMTGVVLIVMSLAVILTAGCNGIELTSSARDCDVVIDGDREDWAGKIRYLDDKNFAVGVMNDESDLYICFSSSDRRLITQTMMNGFTLWFDTESGTKKTFGIGYPLSNPGGGDPIGALRGRGETGTPDQQQFVRRMQYFLSSQYEIEMYGPGENERVRIPVENDEGIHVSADLTESGQYVYEVRIPLKGSSSTPFALATAPGEKLGLTFTTGEMELNPDRMRERGMGPGGGGDMGPGGIPDGGRGGMGPGGGPGGFPNRKPPKPLEVWMTVTLASVNGERTQ
jgi:hypothetical protein